MEQAALLSVVTAFIAFTVAETVIFASLREWAKSRIAWLGKLLACGYCSSVWIALALTAVYRPRLFEAWWPLDYLLTAVFIAWLSAFQWVILCWLIDRVGK